MRDKARTGEDFYHVGDGGYKLGRKPKKDDEGGKRSGGGTHAVGSGKA